MSSQWQNFLRNLGEWRGSFVAIDRQGVLQQPTASILTLEGFEENRLVRFSLRRFGPEGLGGEPISDISQDYRSLGRQVVFFETGSFCKGSLQLAPGTVFGGEFGFVHGDRRHRLVLLYDEAGSAEKLVLIREFRAASEAEECPPLSADQLAGSWAGPGATISADWPEPERAEASLSFDAAEMGNLQWLPDGGYCRWPQQVSHRQAFSTEAGWLTAPGRLERLIRRYDASGAWQSASHQVLQRC
ncbi:MAG: DUF3598 family protein [Prochlorococcaceae cyanobacterium]